MDDRSVPRADIDFFWCGGGSGSGSGKPPSTYRDLLMKVLFDGRTSIFHSPTKRTGATSLYTDPQFAPRRRRRRSHISQQSILYAAGLSENHYSLNLLDWASTNILAIGLRDRVHCLNASNKAHYELDPDAGAGHLVTSISSSPDGHHIAVALTNSKIQIWNLSSERLIRTLAVGNSNAAGSLAWNDSKNYMLTAGGTDGNIVSFDVRAPPRVVHAYQGGHRQEVWGLSWSGSGVHLASGGADKLVHIWDLRRRSPWLHRFEDHKDSVRALSWCPFQGNLIASGGLESDQCIKFWDTHTGKCLNSIDTGSEVCALLWNKEERELLSSHGWPRAQITLWKYPDMEKLTESTGHEAPVMFMAQSPDGCTVASAAGDERLIFWNISEVPQRAAAEAEPFSNFYNTIIRHRSQSTCSQPLPLPLPTLI